MACFNSYKRITTTSLRMRNRPLRLYESNKEFDMSYWTYEEYMYHKLSTYLKNLNKFKADLLQASQNLVQDFPMLKRKSIPHVPLNRSLIQLRNKSQHNNHPINKVKKEQKEEKKLITRASNNELRSSTPKQTEIINNTTKKKPWLLLDLAKAKNSPKTISRPKAVLHLTNSKFRTNPASFKIRKRMPMILKKSPYEVVPKYFKEVRKKCESIGYQKPLVPANRSKLFYSFNNKFY